MTLAMATAPEPPGMFVTVIGCVTSFSSARARAVMRDSVSHPPPAPAGAMISTGRSGKAGPAPVVAARPARSRLTSSSRVANRMSVLLLWFVGGYPDDCTLWGGFPGGRAITDIEAGAGRLPPARLLPHTIRDGDSRRGAPR